MAKKDPSVEEVKRLAKARETFILERERMLGKQITKLEAQLLDQILGKFVGMLINDRGIVSYNGNLITVSQALDKIFEEFNKNENLNVVRGMVEDLSRLSQLNAKYYGVFVSKQSQVPKIKAQVDEVMQERLGLSQDNKFKKGGFLDNFVSDPSLKNYLKTYTLRGVTGGAPYNDFLRGLRVIIQGAPEQDSMLARHYKTFAFDTYSDFDAATGDQWRQKLDLRAAIYAGGLIDTSRKFCIKHNNQVFTIDEMIAWKDDPDLIWTKEERKAGHLIGYIGYINRGRFNCRHNVNWISKELAIRLRPELKAYFEQAL